MKNKNIIIICVSFVIMLGVTIVLRNDKKEDISKKNNYYEVVENSGLMFKGSSVIKDEQKIFINDTVIIEKLHIKDQKEVKKGAVILTCINQSIQEQIDSLQVQTILSSEKLNIANNNKKKFELEIIKKKQIIDETNKKMESLVDELNTDKKITLEQEISMKEQELQMLEENLKVEKTTIDTLEEALNGSKKQIESLEKKLRKKITANIDGLVYINKEGLTDAAVPYIRIIAKESLVKGVATQYNVLNLKVGQKVNLKVISTGEEIKGTIISVDHLPIKSLNETDVIYNFNIKPESQIRLGFSVEIREEIEMLEIPKEYIAKENGKLIVAKNVDNKLDKIEVKGKLDGDYYVIECEKIKPGDKLIINPLEALREE